MALSHILSQQGAAAGRTLDKIIFFLFPLWKSAALQFPGWVWGSGSRAGPGHRRPLAVSWLGSVRKGLLLWCRWGCWMLPLGPPGAGHVSCLYCPAAPPLYAFCISNLL